MDNSKNSMNNDKNLCLYCDKAFSNINDQGNHVERDHKTILNKSKGSLRKSERITKNLCSENSPFAACFYCNNKKLIKSDDLESLFQHLLAAHKDIYFGCKCKTRLCDKISLANHKKNCELGGSSDGSSKFSDEKSSEKRKSSKTSQPTKGSNDLKCDTLLDNTVINSSTAVAPASSNHSVKALPTNAINKKSDKSNVKNSNSKNVVNSNEKRNHNSNKKSKISNISSSSSSSSSSTSSSSSSKTIDEYTIPLTRQKLKEPTVNSNKQSSSSQSRPSSSSSKKVQKNGRSSSSANDNKGASTLHATSSSPSSPTKVQRTKTTKVISHNSQNNCEVVENIQRNDIQNTEFEEDFYKNISHNIRANLNCFIDGKIDRLQLSRPVFDRISSNEHTENGKQPNDILNNHDEKEIHEATNFELSTPFPALLTAEQYGFGDSNPKNKRQITKNSWKWKWDLIKKYKYVNEGGKIVKKVKQITTGLKDLSQLDMWTQLSMRSRYENLNNGATVTEFDDGLNDSLSTRMIKTQNIEQLNSILDKRLMPEINIEQLQQTLVKEELVEADETSENILEGEEESIRLQSDLLSMFKLARVDNVKVTNPALSGEWARPRCFVCIECGQEFDLMKSLTDHKNSEHPYVVSTHYEVVGRENLEQKLYKNLFLPKKALHAKINESSKLLSINSDSKSNEASITSSENSSNNYLSDQKEKECSKCMKTIKYSNDIDVYRHILDCIEDRVWMQAKRRNKYRRSRRKTKKNVKKSRLSNDQKKNTSSPIRKEIAEGDNSLQSNPPTPKDHKKPINPIIKGKTETYVSDGKSNNDGMNIKSFFRVSKTTPNLPQKIVVQMIEMPQNPLNNSLRHSLRSSAKKNTNGTEGGDKSFAVGEENSSMQETSKNELTEFQANDEPIKNEGLTEVERNSTKNNFSLPTTNNIRPALTALQIPDSDKIKSLTSPTNSSSSSSLVSPSLVPKKKKKLNDCIAMLTCKIQEKLGVNFFENSTNEIFPSETTPCKKGEIILSSCSQPLPLPSLSQPTSIPKDNNPDVPQSPFSVPEQIEVIDLSIKKKSLEDQETSTNKRKESENEFKENAENKTSNDKNFTSKCDEIIKEEPTSEQEVKQTENSFIKDSEKCNQNNDKESQNQAAEVKNSTAKSQQVEIETETIKIEDLTESFKISISKDRIPNLNEILQHNSVITVNNLKISESERRAFEEQKNRIMQILNKTKKTTTKKTAKKPPPKKTTVKKNSTQLKEIVPENSSTEPTKVPESNIDNINQDESKTVEPIQKATTQNNKNKKYIETTVEKKAEEPVKKKILYQFPKSESPEKEIEAISDIKEQLTDKTKEQPAEKFSEIKEKFAEKPIDIKQAEPVVNKIIQNKIEQAIKTTNRIRCRRLSVVVDPIIHLSPFHQSNRKIRLTNNSQQNGFYDLLTNDQLFNAIKPQLKDEIKKTCAKAANKAAKNIQNAINEVRAVAAKAASETSKEKEPIVPKSAKQKVNAKVNKKKKTPPLRKYKGKKNTKSQSKKQQPLKVVEVISSPKKALVKPKQTAKVTRSSVSEIKSVEKVNDLMVETPATTKTKASSTKANIDIDPPQKISKAFPKTEEISALSQKTTAEISNIQTATQKKSGKPNPTKAPAKKKAAKFKRKISKTVDEKSKEIMDEIKQANFTVSLLNTENSVTNTIGVVDVKTGEKLSIDISLSSDTSNENDIPLAKLVSLNKEKPVNEVENKESQLEVEEPDPENISVANNKKKKATLKKAPIKSKSHTKSQNIIHKKQIMSEEIKPFEKEKDLTILNEKDIKSEENCVGKNKIERQKEMNIFEFEDSIKSEEEKPKRIKENRNDKLKSVDVATYKSRIEKENVEKLEVFNINEDSFFNDDNDADEKINDLVNNIINSSELVDSETEKIDKQNQIEAKCLVCKRTFRNEKVLEKHNMTTTHLFKVRRREKRIAEQKEKEALKKEKVKERETDQPNESVANATSSEENKIFRTKGALKTFENILAYPTDRISDSFEQPKEFKPVIVPSHDLVETHQPYGSDKKFDAYYEDDDKNEDLSRKDKIFDSLFSNIENKLQAAAAEAANSSITAPPLQKFAFPTLTPHDSELESSSTSWDLKHDADIEWDADNIDNTQPIANVIKEKFPKKSSVKINKSRETAISIPTKSLIMGKIFKKHRDREKQKTPQADAPNNKPEIKNSLDEIFDHLKNSAEIDDKVLTCPSPKTLLKNSGGTFSPHSSHSNDMLETASQSNNSNNNNNNMYSKKPVYSSSSSSDKSCAASSKENKTDEKPPKNSNKIVVSAINNEEEDGIGKRKSRRRCAIKTKTFAETWSSDEYEELHDTNDIISIINEIEKRESNNKRRKISKSESNFVDNSLSKKNEIFDTSVTTSESNHNHKSSTSILKISNESTADKKSTQPIDKNEKKKSVQLQFRPSDIFGKEKAVNPVRKRRMSTFKDGHKSDEETFTATKDLKPLKPTIPIMKKRRMSCFVSSSIFNDNTKPQLNNKAVINKINTSDVLSQSKIDKEIDHPKDYQDNLNEKIGKNQKKILSTVCNNSNSTIASLSATSSGTSKKKVQKHRKRPRNKVKNIAYDSDSDFELNLNRKSKASAFSDSYSEEEEEEYEISHSTKTNVTSQQNSLAKTSNINELTMMKEPKLLPNDLNVVSTTAPAKAAIPEDMNDPTQSACNRTKRHSSEKLYYWSSSSESDVEPGDTADGENEDSLIPQQPEQHGWIVGDSHKKLVTLLAHAKIKNKIN